MARTRILVTGAAGLLGGRLAELLASTHDVIAMRHHAPVPPRLATVDADLLEAGALERALENARPDAVLHGAALADADLCEQDPERARRCNVEASAAVARLCRARGLQLIALSTDLVLAGDVPLSVESAPARPILVYGRTKLEGEEAVLRECPDAAVLRVALVIGRGFGPRSTASESVAAALVAGRQPRLFDDQHRTPIDPESVADAVGRVLEGSAAGRFHLGGAERLSRYELGQRIAQVLRLPAHFEKVSQATQGVRRPADASLDSSRARRELGWTPRMLDDAIREGRRPAV